MEREIKQMKEVNRTQILVRVKEDPLQGSFSTLETCQEMSENSLLSSAGRDKQNFQTVMPRSLVDDNKYEESTVSTNDNFEFEERSIDTENLSDEDDNGDDDLSNDNGYGDVNTARNLYGYQDKYPSIVEKQSTGIYGYGDASPDLAKVIPRRSSMGCVPRRSSMKHGLGSRRASLHFGEEFEVHLPGKHDPVRRKSSITFCEIIKIKPVVPATELTNKVEDLWLQSKDYDRIRERSYDIVDLADEGYKYCTRGLEDLMQENDVRYDSVDTVLDEQDIQRDNGTFDDNAMARVYRLSSIDSRIEANLRAQKDAMAVRKYLRDTRKYCGHLSM
jgi:hypothetical protein